MLCLANCILLSYALGGTILARQLYGSWTGQAGVQNEFRPDRFQKLCDRFFLLLSNRIAGALKRVAHGVGTTIHSLKILSLLWLLKLRLPFI